MARSALALVLLVAACATPYQPFEGHPVLAAIRFEGNERVSAGDLMGHIATAPTSGFFSKTARYYDADLFAIDLKRIVRIYNQKGFYEAKVTGVDELRDEMGRVTLVVKIDEGRGAVIRNMKFDGVEEIPAGEMSDINDALPIHAGDAFTEEGYEKAKDVLERQLKEHGYAQATARGRVQVAPESGTADIVFDIETGQRYQFGGIVVTGNKDIPADAISRATGIRRGDRYSPQALALAQQRVYNLGTFSGVRVTTEPLGDSLTTAVRVNVREAPFQTIRLGGGASIEQNRWEIPRVHAEYTNRSWFGGLRRLELNSTVGYAFVPSALPSQYDSARSGFTTLDTAQLTVPAVFLPGMDWVSRLEFAREIQNGFSYDDVAARTGLTYRRASHSVSGTMNFVYNFNVKVADADQLVQGGGGFQNQCLGGCVLLYPELRYAYDGRDNAIEPTQGFFTTIGLQQSIPLPNFGKTQSTFDYFRFNPEIRVYAPVTKYGVLALRAMYGGLFTAADSPFTQRFFLGGPNDQRGYGPQAQGPKLGVAPCKVGVDKGCDKPYATDTSPVGGNAAVLFSADLRIHADALLNHLLVVPFVDASAIQDGKNPLADGLEVALGLGIRYITPFGPVRFDVGWIANPKDVQAQELTGKDAAGKPVTVTVATPVSTSCTAPPTCIHQSRFAFHLTLGEAF
ncbi:MAG TPA: POTRA domain-containing protein [Myxococcales bacterium]|nr:POTRA domain-containing protein [Myxococcales bacterium]